MATNTLPTPKLKEYVFSEKLGSGTYGDVFKVSFDNFLAKLEKLDTFDNLFLT